MRATYMFGAGDVRVVDAPDPTIEQPTDAVLRVAAACVCGSDLHPFHTMPVRERGSSMGHEMIGVVEEIGADVRTVKPRDVVIVPFVWSCGECDFCREGLQTSCRFGRQRTGGAQAQYRRAPLADGTLYRLDVDEDDERMPGLLTLSDVYGTGYHAALTGGAGPGKTVAVIGDGAVGLLAVLSARQLGAERIILMGRHDARTDLGRRYGATDVVAARGDEGIAAVRDLTGGDGAHVVVDAVGHLPAYEQALGIVRDGGAVSRVGVPQYTSGPIGRTQFDRNITITGGVAPVRAYIDRLLPGILDGTVDPGAVFDREVGLEEIPEAYRLMDAREALKVLVRP
ncbi:alcohol dehydrogenase catalytic domain-containing protein [Microbacterium saccharophilum]|uniref:Alcohol dehydrogenase catalytic domain-containing protein n=2 Tax=Microbacterium saccharophilum TaxID=1213358 RepID=A0A5C8HV38_9MICO|nr:MULTISPECIES: alcohol dehydrogenase catalytic domain-containing protein [Microbacterium]TXK08826.1 alcohol dehydrogenase catalytic domain-containing protein [Microbacterium saccharophilum]GEP48169.1 IMP dehydrogenase [Microbacterium saccharophilum]